MAVDLGGDAPLPQGLADLAGVEGLHAAEVGQGLQDGGQLAVVDGSPAADVAQAAVVVLVAPPLEQRLVDGGAVLEPHDDPVFQLVAGGRQTREEARIGVERRRGGQQEGEQQRGQPLHAARIADA